MGNVERRGPLERVDVPTAGGDQRPEPADRFGAEAQRHPFEVGPLNQAQAWIAPNRPEKRQEADERRHRRKSLAKWHSLFVFRVALLSIADH